MYHNINKEVGFNTISTKRFEEQILYIISNPELRIVSINEYLENLKSQNKNKIITLTFDDAYESIKSEVLPIIKKYNIPITVFIPVNMIGKYNIWDALNGNIQINILTWSEIKNLNNESLITFGSHGLNHISLGSADIETTKEEIVKSKQILENEIGTTIEYFSYPYGQLKDINNESQLILKDFGYRASFTTNWSRKNTIKNIYLLNRIEIKSTDNIESFKEIINRRIDYKLHKQRLKNLLFLLKLYK